MSTNIMIIGKDSVPGYKLLADQEVYMVGSSKKQKVDVRIIAATNKDLGNLVEKGGFRQDLFYRLNVLAIDIPPLRERGDDILLLASHFAEKFAAEAGGTPPRFSDDALRILRCYYWPGNVRELENIVRRLAVMSSKPLIDVPDLPPPMRFSLAPGNNVNRPLAEVETEHVRNVLASVAGNKSKAAKILGIDRKTLRQKLNGNK